MKNSILVLITLLCFTSCHKATHPQKQKIEQLRLNLSQEPAHLDPRKGGDIISSYMHLMLFEGLTRLNPDRSLSLAQAESITISPDGKVYTFYLRDSLWSNGESVTAFDFEKSWKDTLNPSFPSANAHLFYPIKNAELAKKGEVPLTDVGIMAKNAHTLVVTLEQPTPYFLELTSFPSFFPVNQTMEAKTPTWAHHEGKDFVCNGPYLLSCWKHHDSLVLSKNPTYRITEQVVADSIHFSMITDEMTALHLFENQELDMIGHPLSPLPVEALPDLQKKGLLKKQPMAATTAMIFNVNSPPFNNPNIRKAFSYAINREEIVSNITQLNEQIATSVTPPILRKGTTPSFFQDHAIGQAQALLETGLKELGLNRNNLEEITYSYHGSELNRKIAQAIQQQWIKTLGIHVKLEQLDHKILINKMTKHDFILAQNLWIAQYSDPISILERFKSKSNVKNYAGWEDPHYARLIDRSAYETEKDRALTLIEAERLLLDQMPVAPIFHWDFAYIVQPQLQGIGIDTTGNIHFEHLDIQRSE